MNLVNLTRRGTLCLALGVAAALVGAPMNVYRRVGIAFGTTVSIKLEAPDAETAEAAFAAAFAEIRHIDRVASLTREDGDLCRLNRDGRLENPDPALLEMLQAADAMHAATDGAFDVTIQPLWLAFDAAAKRGVWPSDREIRDLLERVDQTRVAYDPESIRFAAPDMGITLNSLARGLAADRVGAALERMGVAHAFFDTDVLGSRGARPDGTAWRAGLRHPRRDKEILGEVAMNGCLATSGDYQYFWTPDFVRNHIIDARRGVSPAAFSSVSVIAKSGLTADALSTAAFLVDRSEAPALVRAFDAEAAFVDKAGVARATSGFPIHWSS
jgi:thiamine biosynthesis lipoprotein